MILPKLTERIDSLLASAFQAPWISSAMRRAALDYYQELGLPSPVTGARRLGVLAESLAGVVSLSAGGQTGHLPPPSVMAAAKRAIDAGQVQYPSVRGYKDFRETMARKLREENGATVDPETEVIPTIGAQGVLDGTIRILADPGDEVLLIDPEYASIEPLVAMAGAKCVRVPLRWDGDRWTFDLDNLVRQITPSTKLLILSNGNNPTGYLYTHEDLEGILALATKHDFFILSDEEYERIVFDGRQHVSLMSLPSAKERVVLALSFSKAYVMTGFRIGCMVARAEIIEHMYNIVRFSIQAAPSISQWAAIAVVNERDDAWLAATVADLQRKRDYTVTRLRQMPGIKCGIPHGVYFAFPDIRAYRISSQEMAEFLLVREKVSVLPGYFFGPNGEGHVRVSFCIALKQLEQGLDQMEQALNDLAASRELHFSQRGLAKQRRRSK